MYNCWTLEFPEVVEVANNNVAIAIFDGRIYLGFRSSQTHFASESTKMIIASAVWNDESLEKLKFNWRLEQTVAIGFDVREPYFLETSSGFYFYYFKAGADPTEFKPDTMFRWRYNPDISVSTELLLVSQNISGWKKTAKLGQSQSPSERMERLSGNMGNDEI